MLKLLPLIIVLALLAGCVSSPLPDGYKGLTATISDSFTRGDAKKSDFFWVDQVDGRKIEDSVMKTSKDIQGRGFFMEPKNDSRPIAAQKVTLTIKGSTVYAADILAMIHKIYSVEGQVTIDAQPGVSYVVKGELGQNGCSVWIEDASSGKMVSEKITK